MAQKQYTTYQADILSFELRDALLGIAKPGRYIGFDQMTERIAQSGNIIYCRISHLNGINKYDQATPPVLEAERGVAVSTQGCIISEDGFIDISVTITPASSTGIWHLIYMDHAYTAVPGANNATYGFISGTDGGGKPTLTLATRRIIIGYIWEPATPVNFSDLVYYPFQTADLYGDSKLGEKLWGDDEVLDTATTGNVGTVPAAGIIGNRNFTTNNYLTDFTSITEALSDLDAALQTEETTRIALGNRAIDNAAWGTLTDNTNHNVSITTHGLIPILPNDAAQFLGGTGAWQDIYDYAAQFGFERSGPPTILNISSGSSTGGTVDVTPTYAPVGAKAIIVDVYFAYDTVLGSGSCIFNMWDADYVYSNGPGLSVADTAHSTGIPTQADAQWIIPINAAGEFDWGTTNAYHVALTVKLNGYIL